MQRVGERDAGQGVLGELRGDESVATFVAPSIQWFCIGAMHPKRGSVPVAASHRMSAEVSVHHWRRHGSSVAKFSLSQPSPVALVTLEPPYKTPSILIAWLAWSRVPIEITLSHLPRSGPPNLSPPIQLAMQAPSVVINPRRGNCNKLNTGSGPASVPR